MLQGLDAESSQGTQAAMEHQDHLTHLVLSSKPQESPFQNTQ